MLKNPLIKITITDETFLDSIQKKLMAMTKDFFDLGRVYDSLSDSHVESYTFHSG